MEMKKKKKKTNIIKINKFQIKKNLKKTLFPNNNLKIMMKNFNNNNKINMKKKIIRLF